MAQTQIPVVGSILTTDTAATKSTLVQRDTSSGISVVAVTATGNISAPTHSLTVSSSQTSTFTLDTTASLWLCDATGGAITVNLPAAATVPGYHFFIIKTDSSGNAVTLDGSASETINGSTTSALASQYSVAHIVSTGSAWLKV